MFDEIIKSLFTHVDTGSGKPGNRGFSTPASRLACLKGLNIGVTKHAAAFFEGILVVVIFLQPDAGGQGKISNEHRSGLHSCRSGLSQSLNATLLLRIGRQY